MSQALALAFLEAGDTVGGEPLIVMHGLFGSARNWQMLVKRFAERRHVFALDLRNHGGSPWDADMSYPAMAADVARFIEDRGWPRATLLGHSMGGKVAMALALTRPELVSRLIVADIAPVQYTHTHGPYVAAMQAAKLEGATRRGEIDAQLADAVPVASLRAFLMQNLVMEHGKFFWRINLDAVAAGMDGLIGFPDLAPATFDKPTLFIGGTASEYITAAQSAAIFARFPTAKITMMEGAGHWVHAERPDAFAELVEDFV
jgi:esterase